MDVLIRGVVHDMDRNQLLDRLIALLPVQFAELVFRLRVPPQHISQGAPQATCAIEVVRYLESQGRLDELERVMRESRPVTPVSRPPRCPVCGQNTLSEHSRNGGDLLFVCDRCGKMMRISYDNDRSTVTKIVVPGVLVLTGAVLVAEYLQSHSDGLVHAVSDILHYLGEHV